MHSHLRGDEVERLLSGKGTPSDSSRLVLALLGGCERCASAVRQVVKPPQPTPGAYDEVFERVEHRAAYESACVDFVRARRRHLLGNL